MSISTADLYDTHEGSNIQIASPICHINHIPVQNYGGTKSFFGQIVTVSCFEDNSFVRKTLSKDGQGKVLVVDGAASLNCALLGDQLAKLGIDHSWSGIIVNGCIRDSLEIGTLAIGVKALGVMPKKSVKNNQGEVNIDVSFWGIRFTPNAYIYADLDGIIVSQHELINT